MSSTSDIDDLDKASLKELVGFYRTRSYQLELEALKKQLAYNRISILVTDLAQRLGYTDPLLPEDDLPNYDVETKEIKVKKTTNKKSISTKKNVSKKEIENKKNK
jgi:hypothetical protein